MRLSYRGVHYHHEPTPVDLVESGISGQHRGQAFAFTYPRHIPVPQPTVQLKYRNVAYQTTATGTITSVPAGVHPELAAGERTVAIPLPLKSRIRQVQNSDLTKVHLENIRQRLQHRINVAKDSGDTTLLRELEKEMHLFA
jgi:hypothetical protein